MTLEWFDKLEAPRKHMFSFENAAHSVAFEQFEAFHNLMLDTVLPASSLTSAHMAAWKVSPKDRNSRLAGEWRDVRRGLMP